MDSSPPPNDTFYMERALELARQGEGFVEPNPMVGCVLVKNDQIIGEGWHKKFGKPHAEIEALNDCSSPEGAWAFVTLEPCSHHGKTGPCAEAMIEAGLSRVVVATNDPNPLVNGQGIKRLRDAGIEVVLGVCEDRAIELLQPFSKHLLENLPWTIAKWAMTMDGKIATGSGSSKWISNDASRAIVHQIRGRMDAILVGIGTVLADDPMLTARPTGARIAHRVVMDSMCRIPVNSQLIKTAHEIPVTIGVSSDAPIEKIEQLKERGCDVFVCNAEDRSSRIIQLLRHLAKNGCTNLLVEGGSAILGSLHDHRLIDEVHCFIAPKLAGGMNGLTPIAGLGINDMSQSIQIASPIVRQIENDIYVSGRISRIKKGDA